MRFILCKLDESTSATKIANKIDVFQAMSWLSSAWSKVSPSTITACFKRCGFSSADCEEELVAIDEDLPDCSSIEDGVTFNEFTNFDKALPTHDTRSGENTEGEEEEGEKDEVVDEEGEKDEVVDWLKVSPIVSWTKCHQNMQEVLEKVIDYGEKSLITNVMSLQESLIQHHVASSGKLKQKKISDFF